MILTRDGKKIVAIYKRDGTEVDEVYGGLNYTKPIFYSLKTLTGATSYSFMGYPEPLKSYEISGNMVQNGTPAPTSPIYPQECGDNEYSDALLRNGTYIDTLDLSTGLETLVNERIVLTGNEDIKYYGTYGVLRLPHFYIDFGAVHNINTSFGSLLCTHYASSDEDTGIGNFCCRYQATSATQSNINRVYIADNRFNNLSQFVSYVRNQYESGTPIVIQKIRDIAYTKTINVPEGLSGYVYGYSNQDDTPSPTNVIEIQNNSFNYYKIPINLNGTTQNLYLTEPLRKIGDYADSISSDGTVERKIDKFVLTGEENWASAIFSGHNGFMTYAPKFQIGTTNCFCSHYKVEYLNLNNTIYFVNQPRNGRFIIFDDRFSSTDDFKSFLAEQYAAGTPVTIWYVIEVPTTEQVIAPTLTPATGNNTLAIGTTLQPSSVSITGHIKPSS